MTAPDFFPNRGVADTPPCLFSPPSPIESDSGGPITLGDDRCRIHLWGIDGLCDTCGTHQDEPAPKLITSHVWRRSYPAGSSSACGYSGCGRPRTEHER
jgi:hypothetical protein